MESLPPIPTPPSQRWREFRIQILPLLVFVAILATIALMWRSFVQPSGVVGEVEAVKVNVISLQDGVIAELTVDRLQYVTNGQVIGRIITTDPELMRASVANIQSEFKVLRARMRLDERRNDQNVQQMRLDVYEEKMLRDIAFASLALASNSLRQSQSLFTAGLDSQLTLNIYKAEVEKFQTEIQLRTQTIADRERLLNEFAAGQSATNDPVIEEAIKAGEEALNQELKPNSIRAPMDGVVTAIYRRTQERVVRGEPLVTISATSAERIVGYIRQPVQIIPNENDVVVVRTRTMKRQMGEGQILKVGALFEPINPFLISTDSNRVELGLPILVSLPKGLTLSPGEFVDLSIRYAKR